MRIRAEVENNEQELARQTSTVYLDRDQLRVDEFDKFFEDYLSKPSQDGRVVIDEIEFSELVSKLETQIMEEAFDLGLPGSKLPMIENDQIMEPEIAPQLSGAENDKGEIQRQMIRNKLKEIAERDSDTVASSAFEAAGEGGRNPEQTLLALIGDFV